MKREASSHHLKYMAIRNLHKSIVNKIFDPIYTQLKTIYYEQYQSDKNPR